MSDCSAIDSVERSEDQGGEPGGIVQETFQAAREAQPAWQATPMGERLGRIRRFRHLLAESACTLAETLAEAQSRPVREVLSAEIMPLLASCRFLERQAAKILRCRKTGWVGRPLWLAGVESRVERVPFGVVLIIGPSNYPLFLPGVQTLQALTAGNAVVLKPGRAGTVAASQFCDLLQRAGFEPGLVNLLPETRGAGQVALAARADKVLFTGSSQTGRHVLACLGGELIPTVAELGGCDSVMVREDADLGLVTRALVFGVRLNGGATCLAPRRVLVATARLGELENRLAAALRDTPARDKCGIMSTGNENAHPELGRLVDDALARGARRIAAGTDVMVLSGVGQNSRLLRQDLFGPWMVLVGVKSDEESLGLVNASPFALGLSIFTRDEQAARSLAGAAQVGVVCINDLIVPTADPRLPFGGRRASGYGVTRGAEGLLELTVPKVVTVSRGPRPALGPSKPGDVRWLLAYVQAAHGPWSVRWRAVRSLFRGESQAGVRSI